MGYVAGLVALALWLIVLFAGLYVLNSMWMSISRLPPVSMRFAYAFLCLAFLTVFFIVVVVALIIPVCLAFKYGEENKAKWLWYLYSSKK